MYSDIHVWVYVSWRAYAGLLLESGLLFNAGHPVALYNVGGHYFAGKGVGLSFKKAAEYFQKAADLGFAPAQVQRYVK